MKLKTEVQIVIYPLAKYERAAPIVWKLYALLKMTTSTISVTTLTCDIRRLKRFLPARSKADIRIVNASFN